MAQVPSSPKIYHITHVSNLSAILADGDLVSDREILSRGGTTQAIGMSEIKNRRLEDLEVLCHQGTKVGDYVPFYFCPRSVMLYVIHRGNHQELSYREGQGQIVHLEADLDRVISWADANDRRWAFSLSNAGAFYTEFRSLRSELVQLDWAAIGAKDFRESTVKERKQAEFLVHERFPFALVERIGVVSAGTLQQAKRALSGANPLPLVEQRSDWYF